MSENLETLAKMVVARKAKIAQLDQKIKNHEEVLRWQKERQNHKDAIGAHLREAHKLILGRGSFEQWVKENCHFTRMSAYRYMGMLPPPEEPEEAATEEPEEAATEEPEEAATEEPKETQPASTSNSVVDAFQALKPWDQSVAMESLWGILSPSQRQRFLAYVNRSDAA